MGYRRGVLTAAAGAFPPQSVDRLAAGGHRDPGAGLFGYAVLGPSLKGDRHTWWHQGMRDDALARMRHVQWDGVVMVEYRWDDDAQDFCFLEMNTRYWAALHLDLFAGMDFPRVQFDAFFGRPAAIEWTYRKVTARYTIRISKTHPANM